MRILPIGGAKQTVLVGWMAKQKCQAGPARAINVDKTLHAVNDPLADVRVDKVAQLRAAIAGGEYHVSAEDLADKLMAAFVGPQQLDTRIFDFVDNGAAACVVWSLQRV